MLSDFFRINLPYGMKRNTSGEWMFFNREYMPLGWNNTEKQQSINDVDAYSEYPVYTKYKRLSDAVLEKLAWATHGVQRDDTGKIKIVFFYNDRTNPQNDATYWSEYLQKIQLLSKCEVKPVHQL